MAWFLFIDESGHDRRESPYEVLAGVAIEDRMLWPLINELHIAETQCFGTRYSNGNDELKGRKILKKKVFQHLNLNVPIEDQEVPELARFALENGSEATIRHLKALAKAKTRYCSEVFQLLDRFGGKVFASMVELNAHRTASDGLRKDYAYLFERFFYFLQDMAGQVQGLIVFDELEKSQSHILIDQTHRYFKETVTGKTRASHVIPEPLFVHSDLTTGIQLADLAAYCLSWAFRTVNMDKPVRRELLPYAGQLARLRYRTTRTVNNIQDFEIWSVAHITDLRTSMERNGQN